MGMKPHIVRQSGAALITALLITAIATTAAVAIAARQQFDIRRTSNLLETDQAYLFALGVEDWAREIMIRDKKDSSSDDLAEDWATILPPIAVEGGLVSGRIVDMQGRYNLNNLIVDDKPSTKDVEYFRRLIQALGLNVDLVEAVVDWIDKNEDDMFPNGAEDNEYLGLDLAYRAANRPMASISELLLIKGFDQETYSALAHHVSALPVRTKVNVNTATAEVLEAMIKDLGSSEAAQLVEEMEEEGFENIADFTSNEQLSGLVVDVADVDVASSYFMVEADASYGRAHIYLYSLLSRDKDGGVQTVMRGQGAY